MANGVNATHCTGEKAKDTSSNVRASNFYGHTTIKPLRHTTSKPAEPLLLRTVTAPTTTDSDYSDSPWENPAILVQTRSEVERITGLFPFLGKLETPNSNFYIMTAVDNRTRDTIYTTNGFNIPMRIESSNKKGTHQTEHVVVRTIFGLTSTSGFMETCEILREFKNLFGTPDAIFNTIQLQVNELTAKGVANTSSRENICILVQESLHRDKLNLNTPYKTKGTGILLSFNKDLIVRKYPNAYTEPKGTGVEKHETRKHIEVVDPHTNDTYLYTHMAGETMPILINKSHDREPGIYITKEQYNILNNKYDTETTVYPLWDMNEVGIYRTEEEADTSGDPGKLKDKEIAEFKYDMSTKAIELEQVKHNNAIEKTLVEMQKQLDDLSLTRQKKQLEFEAAMQDLVRKTTADSIKEAMDARRMYREDYYDERSVSRKNSIEIMKMVPAVLSVASLAGTLYLSMRDK